MLCPQIFSRSVVRVFLVSLITLSGIIIGGMKYRAAMIDPPLRSVKHLSLMMGQVQTYLARPLPSVVKQL